MSEFVNTIELLGDDAVIDSIIDRSITEFKDDTITKIGGYAFNSCVQLVELECPEVTSIGANAFQGCAALLKVDIPKVVTFGLYAFKGCAILTSANIPEATAIATGCYQHCFELADIKAPKATTIGQYTLEGSKIVIADFPKLTAISAYAFRSCSVLRALILRNSATVCGLLGTNALSTTPIGSGSGYIYVPKHMDDGADGIATYEAASNWSTFAGQFRYIEDYTVDGTLAGEIDETKI